MTVAELSEVLRESADELNGTPLDVTEKLIEKLAAAAAQSRTSVLSLNVASDGRFTNEERALCTAAVFERAQRRQHELAGKETKKASSLEVVKEGTEFFIKPRNGGSKKHGPYKTRKEATKKLQGILGGAKQAEEKIQASQAEAVATGEHVEAAKKSDEPVESPPNVFRRDAHGEHKAGWWFMAMVGTKNEEFGPYDTRKEADEARISYKRNNIEAIQKAGLQVSVDAPKQKKTKQPSEPSAADAGTETTAPQATEDDTVKTKSKKKARTEPAKNSRDLRDAKSSTKPANGKPKAKKAEGKMSALDAAAEVLKGRSKAMSAKELIALIEERGLWKSPGGATPDATLSAAIGREIAGKGKDSRFCKPEPGRFLHA